MGSLSILRGLVAFYLWVWLGSCNIKTDRFLVFIQFWLKPKSFGIGRPHAHGMKLVSRCCSRKFRANSRNANSFCLAVKRSKDGHCRHATAHALATKIASHGGFSSIRTGSRPRNGESNPRVLWIVSGSVWHRCRRRAPSKRKTPSTWSAPFSRTRTSSFAATGAAVRSPSVDADNFGTGFRKPWVVALHPPLARPFTQNVKQTTGHRSRVQKSWSSAKNCIIGSDPVVSRFGRGDGITETERSAVVKTAIESGDR